MLIVRTNYSKVYSRMSKYFDKFIEKILIFQQREDADSIILVVFFVITIILIGGTLGAKKEQIAKSKKGAKIDESASFAFAAYGIWLLAMCYIVFTTTEYTFVYVQMIQSLVKVMPYIILFVWFLITRS